MHTVDIQRGRRRRRFAGVIGRKQEENKAGKIDDDQISSLVAFQVQISPLIMTPATIK